MPKTRTSSVPDTRTLVRLMEEYEEMLHNAERGVRKVLALSPETERFWDALTEVAPKISLVGDRSNSIWEETVDLVDQLPQD